MSKIKVRYTKQDTRFDYSSSLIAQDFSESEHAHGILVWDIEDKDTWRKQFIDIPNEYSFYTFRGKGIDDLKSFDFDKIPNKVTFRSIFEDELSIAEIKEIGNILRKALPNAEKILPPIHNTNRAIAYASKDNAVDMISTITKYDSQIQFMIDYLKKNETGISERQIEVIREIHKKYYDELSDQDKLQKDYIKNWGIESIEWDNLFSYGEGNKIDFKNMSGVIGIFGDNWIGKSSALRTILWSIYNNIPEAHTKAEDVLNKYSKEGSAKITLSHLDKQYVIDRGIKRSGKKVNGKLDVKENGVDLNESSITQTDKKVIQAKFGTMDDILLSNFASQNQHLKLIEMSQSERKDIIHKFLGIDMYELFYKLGSKEKNTLKAQLDKMTDKNIYDQVEDNEKKLSEATDAVKKYKKELSKLEKELETTLKEQAEEIERANEDTTSEKLEQEIEIIKTRLSNLETGFNEDEFKEKGEKYAKLKKDKKRVISEIDSFADVVSVKQNKIKELQEEIEQAEELIKKYTKQGKDAFASLKDVYGSTDLDDLLKDEKADSKRVIDVQRAERNIERAESELKTIEENSGTFVNKKDLYIGNDSCYECDFIYRCLDIEDGSLTEPLTEEEYEKIKARISTSFSELETDIEALKKSKDDLEKAIRFTSDQYEDIQERRSQLVKLNRDKEAIVSKKETVEGNIERLKEDIVSQGELKTKNEELKDSLTSEIESIEKYIMENSSYVEELEKIKDTEKELSDKENELEQFKIDLANNIKNMVRNHERVIRGIKDDVVSIKEKVTENYDIAKTTEGRLEILKDSLLEFEKLSEEYQIYDYYCTAVHKDGVPSEIVRIALPHVNAEMRNILSLFNFGFSAELEYDDENQKVQIYVSKDYDEESRIIVELGSGAQKVIVSIILRIAFSTVSSVPSPNFFIIDEGFDAFDKTNLQILPKLFELLKSFFRHVIIITHLDEVKDMVEETIPIDVYQKKGKDGVVRTFSKIDV